MLLTEGESRTPSQTLLDDRVHVWKGVVVREVGKATRTDAVDVVLGFALDVRIKHHGEDERSQYGYSLTVEDQLEFVQLR